MRTNRSYLGRIAQALTLVGVTALSGIAGCASNDAIYKNKIKELTEQLEKERCKAPHTPTLDPTAVAAKKIVDYLKRKGTGFVIETLDHGKQLCLDFRFCGDGLEIEGRNSKGRFDEYKIKITDDKADGLKFDESTNDHAEIKTSGWRGEWAYDSSKTSIFTSKGEKIALQTYNRAVTLLEKKLGYLDTWLEDSRDIRFPLDH